MGIAFIVASSAAYLAAVAATIGLFLLVSSFLGHGGGGWEHVHVPAPVFFGGGYAGSFLVLAAALLLFRHASVRWSTLARIPKWALAGGVLGVIGWLLGPLLGDPLLRVLETLHLRPSWESYAGALSQQRPEYFSLYAVWQTGMAFLLGLVLSGEQAIAPATATPASQGDAPVRTARRTMTTVAILFAGALFAFLGWSVSMAVRAERASAQQLQAARQALAETPPIDHLPPVQEMTSDQVLVVEDVGGFFVKEPYMSQRAKGLVPETVTYSVTYVADKNASALSPEPWSGYLSSSIPTPTGRGTRPGIRQYRIQGPSMIESR